jgi:hypothetical protein
MLYFAPLETLAIIHLVYLQSYLVLTPIGASLAIA